jgi:hypothetical protein
MFLWNVEARLFDPRKLYQILRTDPPGTLSEREYLILRTDPTSLSRDLERAKRYLEWTVHCRPDAAGTHEALGDYYVAVHDLPAAIHSYEAALQRGPDRASVKMKLAKLGKR